MRVTFFRVNPGRDARHVFTASIPAGMRVTFFRVNPGRDAGIKPRVSPRTRGHVGGNHLNPRRGWRRVTTIRSLCMPVQSWTLIVPNEIFANQGRHPPRGLVLLFTRLSTGSRTHPWLYASTLPGLQKSRCRGVEQRGMTRLDGRLAGWFELNKSRDDILHWEHGRPGRLLRNQ